MTKRHAPLDDYFEAKPLLLHVRIMQRFISDVVDENPEWRKHLPDLHGAYMDILNEALAPHALTFALALTELEEAFPAILDAKPPSMDDL